jgi:hypothetical protein
MGSPQAFSRLKLEDIQKLLGVDAPQMATPTRVPAQTQAAEDYTRQMFAEKPDLKLQSKLREKVINNIGKDALPKANPGYDDTKVAWDIGGNDLPPERTPEEAAALAASIQPPVIPEGTKEPTIEDLLTPDFTLPKKEDLASLLQETTAFSPELNSELNKYAATLNQANMSPWAALADKWSGGGTHLSDVAKLKNTTGSLDREKLRQESIKERQLTGIQSNVAKDYINQLEKDIKPLQDVNRAGKAAKINLTPDKNGNVEIAKVENIAALAGRALANIGVQTDKDATRTVLPTLELTIAKVLAYIKSKPDQPVPFTLVKPLLETLNSVEEAYREEVNEKVAVTRDAYIAGRGLDSARADVVLSPYKKLLEAQSVRLQETKDKMADAANPGSGARAKDEMEALKKILKDIKPANPPAGGR